MNWLLNYRDKIATYMGVLGVGEEEVSKIREDIESCVAAGEHISQLKARLHEAQANQRLLEKSIEERIRTQMSQAKSRATLTDEIKRQLRVDVGTSNFEPGASRPSFQIEIEAGAVRIEFEKGQFDAVNIYSRIVGEPTWRFIARDTNSPYVDCSPLVVSDAGEIREYVLRGVVDDLEMGQTSVVRSVNCGNLMRDVRLEPRKRVGRWA